MKQLKIVVVVLVCCVMSACSTKLEGVPGAVLGGTFSGSIPSDEKSVPPYTPPSECVDFAANYQMNADYITITQEDCMSQTWLWHGNEHFGTKDVVIVYNGDDVERQIPDAKAGEQKFQRSHFETDRFVVEERIVTANDTQQRTRTFTLTNRPCDLYNPEPGVTYLEEKSDTHCNFWARTTK